MATRTTFTLEDDLDGGKADETVTFGLDGNAYEIDLSGRNAERLRKAFASYIQAGRRTGRTSSGRRRSLAAAPAQRTSDETAAIRDWARSNGYDMSDRGRISEAVLQAYAAGG